MVLRLMGLLTLTAVLVCGDTLGQDKPKVKAEEILAKHAESVGTPEALAASINRKFQGTAQVRNVRRSTSTILGGAFLASTAEKHLALMAFESASQADYKGDRIIFDGRKLTIPYVTAAERSPVGTFVFEYPEIAQKYMFGGALFASWALLDAGKVGKFELQGREKIEGVETFKIKYTPKGGSSLNIRMYFDAATFRHLRTEYTRTETAGTVRVDEGRLNENRYKLIEDFADFGEFNGLTLPKTYKVTFRYETLRSSSEIEWVIKLTRFGFDPKAEPEIFSQGLTP